MTLINVISVLGQSVSLSSDGGTLAVGGPGDDYSNGATWIFVFDKSTNQYKQLGSKLVGSGSVGPSRQGKNILIEKNHVIHLFVHFFIIENWQKRYFRLVGMSVVGWRHTCRWGSYERIYSWGR